MVLDGELRSCRTDRQTVKERYADADANEDLKWICYIRTPTNTYESAATDEMKMHICPRNEC